jgi:hypothetical protein
MMRETRSRPPASITYAASTRPSLNALSAARVVESLCSEEADAHRVRCRKRLPVRRFTTMGTPPEAGRVMFRRRLKCPSGADLDSRPQGQAV